MKVKTKLAVASLSLMGILGTYLLVSAQEYSANRGSNARTGRMVGNVLTDTPGRAFLRWFDPIVSIENEIDNWEATKVTATPLGGWVAPADFDEATGAIQTDTFGASPNYYWSALVDSKSNGSAIEADSGTPNTFAWNFKNAVIGAEYALYVNLPVGPTDTDSTDTLAFRYPQRYFVYEISGIQNPENAADTNYTVIDVVDTYASGGGYVRLGNGGLATEKLFVAKNTQVNIKLFNTIPRDGQNRLTDTRDKSILCVYADSAKLVEAAGALGSIVAQPIVAKLRANAPDAQVSPYPANPWRVFSARNEDTLVQVGSEARSYNMGILSAFRHNGIKVNQNDGPTVNVNNVDTLGGKDRRNTIFSWPASRPFVYTKSAQPTSRTFEVDRFLDEKRDFILGTGKWKVSHADQAITVDNRNWACTPTVNWNLLTVLPTFKGTDYLQINAQLDLADTITPTSQRTNYRPLLPKGDYVIDVWTPGGDTLAREARVEVYQGPNLVGVGSIDQTGTAGWRRVKVNDQLNVQYSKFANDGSTTGLPLSMAITDQSTEPNDAGRKIVADMVRFTRQADLSITSTPVFATTTVNDNGDVQVRDVVIVTMENGKLYCLDAKGFMDGTIPQGDTKVYWTYPSELPDTTADPNQGPGFDGKDGIAEMPTGFNTSSALVENVRIGANSSDTRSLLYVGTTNGRVYCIDMVGRGDGTTFRRWSYPNDFPTLPQKSNLGPIVGSVTYAEVTNTTGDPVGTIFVPTINGRLLALDAAGDEGTRTTTVAWQFPAATEQSIGPIRMTPAILNGKVYFGTGDGGPDPNGNNKLFALRTRDNNGDAKGDELWRSSGTTEFPFGAFGRSAPAVLSAIDIGLGSPASVFVSNSSTNGAGVVYQFNADTGANIWQTDELKADASGSLTFTYMTTFTRSKVLDNPTIPGRPVILVPTIDGRFSGLFARLADYNGDKANATITSDSLKKRYAWGYRSKGGNATSMAVGARIPGGSNPQDEEHCWIYGGDDLGYLFAWSFDPDYPEDSQILTPGDPPIFEEPSPDDPITDQINEIATTAKVSLLSPDGNRDVLKKIGAGGLSRSELDSHVNPGEVTRINYEFGETIYPIVYDLPDASAFNPAVNYSVELQFTAPGSATQRRTLPLQKLKAEPPSKTSRYAISTGFTFQATGASSLAPGKATLRVTITASQRRTRNGGGGSNLTVAVPSGNFKPSSDLQLANPLGIGPRSDKVGAIGANTIVDDPLNLINGNGTKIVSGLFGERFDDKTADQVAHGSTGFTSAYVWDRSLVTLSYGTGRGLQNVRFSTTSLNWNANTGLASTYKPLPAAQFKNFEQVPGPIGNNVSADYPDLAREQMTITKQTFGDVENPLFQPVGLDAPDYTSSQFGTYRTAAGYNAGLVRSLVATRFDVELDVPRYQPPCRNNFSGDQYVFVDSGQPGLQFAGAAPIEAHRVMKLDAAVAVDETLKVGTPVVELGSIPGGGGYLPTFPWDAAYRFDDARVSNTRTPFFSRFSVLNDGNVNMLNLRLAKSIDGQLFSSELNGANNHEASFLDTTVHLHSDIDPRYTKDATRPAVNILQKARVGDGAPTRFRVNPIRRANAVTGTREQRLFTDTSYPNPQAYQDSIQDPRVAVSVPIGTPTGKYNQTVYPFEDRGVSLDNPSMGKDTDPDNLYNDPTNSAFEPYSEPGFTISFSVVETQLTNGHGSKTAPMVDPRITVDNTGAPLPFLWSNQEPTGARDGSGNLIVAWASNRLENNDPGWLPRLRNANDMANAEEQWRIYIGTLSSGDNSSLTERSPLRNLNHWKPSTNGRWFNQAAGPYPTGAASTYFGANTDAKSVRFGYPAFSSSGFYNPFEFDQPADGKAAGGFAYMAFIGEANRQTGQGDLTKESRVFLARVSSGINGISVTDPIPLEVGGVIVDRAARFGRPSVVQSGNEATVFIPINSAGSTQIYWARYDGTRWVTFQGGSALRALPVSSAFESISSPSASARLFTPPPGNNPKGLMDVAFAARIRGRASAEVFLGSFAYNNWQGGPRSGDNIPWSLQFDRMEVTGNGTFWSRGADWLDDEPSVRVETVADPANNPIATRSIDIKRALRGTGTPVYESILRQETKRYDKATRTLSVDTIFGGKALFDLNAGSVRLTGSLVPLRTELYIRYTPRWVRISTSIDKNHRNVNVVFDSRYSGDLTDLIWFTDSNGQAARDAAKRSDRYVVTYGRTSSDGSSVAQPFLKSYRLGVRVPVAPEDINDLTDRNGNPRITVLPNYNAAARTGMRPGTFYQLDLPKLQIYFSSENEGQTVTVRAAGKDYVLQVGLIEELQEQAIPMDRPTNESNVFLALDSQGGNFQSRQVPGPGLLWMFWTSSRTGAPDVFMQTLAPRYRSKPSVGP